MQDLPVGIVTFLFTDIVGSTALWEHAPAAAHAVLVRHDALIEHAVECCGGTLVRPRGEGDSRFAVFTRATDALAAAAAMQQALHAEPWPTDQPLRVRIALHTGEADLRAGDYYGQAVNRCARLRAVAHGGQTLLSHATFDLVRDAVADGSLAGISLRDLGEHRLTDLIRPEHIHQLVVQGVPDAFPPLASLDAHRHNLPVQRSPLLGRETEVGAVTALLLRPDAGLVTLTGPGGTGKTRLSLQVAGELIGSFPDGVFLVELAPLTDPDLVAPTIATILDVKADAGQPVSALLQRYLASKRLLLVLDNFEHVVAAAPIVSELLRHARHLKVLVTSRHTLRVTDEQEYRVPPLALPDLQPLPPIEHLSQYAAVRLFIQRAQAATPDFQVTNANAPAVAAICVRLDGLPLAIELAAGRIKFFTPDALLQRLDSRLKTLTGGPRDRDVRQQTLRGAIDWSYSLLDAAEQALFRRLGIFSGGGTIDDVEGVWNVDGDLALDTVDGLQSLVDKSLVHQATDASGAARFGMLATLREYALERLEASGELETVRQRHVACYVALAEAAAPRLYGPEQGTWLRRLAAEQDNLRAVLGWSLTTADSGDWAPVERGMRLAAALWYFWVLHEAENEGRRWSEGLLSRGADAPAAARAPVLYVAGDLARLVADLAHATARLEASRALFQTLGDCHGSSRAVSSLGNVAWAHGDFPRAASCYAESLTVFEELGDNFWAGWMLHGLGSVAHRQGDYPRARAYFEECVRRFRAGGNLRELGGTLVSLADLAYDQGQYPRATALYEEAHALLRDVDVGGAMAVLARLWSIGGAPDEDDAEISAQLHETLARQRQQGSRQGMVMTLMALGELAWRRRDLDRARLHHEEAVALARDGGCQGAFDRTRYNLGRVALEQQDLAVARGCLAESLAAARQQGESQMMLACLEGLAGVASAEQRPEAVRRAATLWGAAAAIRAGARVQLPPLDRADHARTVATAQARCDAAAWESAWAEGQALTLEQAITVALEQRCVRETGVEGGVAAPGVPHQRAIGSVRTELPCLHATGGRAAVAASPS